MAETRGRFYRKLAALALGSAVGAAVLWSYAVGSRAVENARYEESKDRAHELVREHARAASDHAREASDQATNSAPADSGSTVSSSHAARDPLERPYYLAPAVAQQLFLRDSSFETYDPWCYFRHKPNRRIHVDWAEHPRGGWTWVTNSLGLREDRELSSTPPDLRVLVTGDSHADGFCDNSEAFAHVAEAELAGKRPGQKIEIINAANGGFSFYNYLGALERFVGLAPDAFVLSVYAGNDFVEVLLPEAYFSRQPPVEQTKDQRAELARAKAISGPAVTQAFFALIHFRERPEEVERSLRTAVSLVSEMRAICDAHATRMLVLLIPSAQEASWAEFAPVFERCARELSLSTEDLSRTDRMADEFLMRIEKAGVETLDVRELFRTGTGPWFWKKDLHMNVRAHAAVGSALARRIESWGGKFAR